MKYNAKFTKIEDGYYRAKINNVELWEVDELLVWTIKEREKEIERLNNTIKGLDNTIENLEEVIKHKDSIIKEAREYITKQVHRNQQFYEMDIDNILEILDKVEEK